MSIPTPGSEELITTIEPGQIVLANIPMQVTGGVSFSLLNVAGHKIQQGEPGPDDHPVDSTIISRSNTGGGQALYNRGDQDKDRYDDGNADTDHLELMSLPPAITAFAGPNTNQAMLHGQYPNNLNSKVYATWGNQLCKLNVAGTAFTAVGTYTTDLPVSTKSVNYALPGTPSSLKMIIPCETSFHTWDGTTLARTVLPARDFVVWEQKLFRLTPDGLVYWTNDLSTWTLVGSLCDGSDPRHLTVFYDRNNTLAVHVITSDKVYALDFGAAVLFETDQFWPKHPNFGRGVCRWRADLYISGGIGVQRQSNGFINAVGLDRDFSLPARLAGWIVDLEPGFNNYFALVRGESVSGATPSTGNLRLGGQETMQASVGSTVSSLFGWSGLGWRKWWEGQGIPTTCFIANPPGEYWLYWAAGSTVYRVPLTMNYYNPREVQKFPFAATAEHITSRYNWGWVNIPKIIKRWECYASNLSPASNIQVYYRVDDPDAAWSLLGTLTQNGRQSLKFGEVNWDAQTLHYGLTHEWIQFRYVFNGDPANPYVSPYLEWFALVGRKFVTPIRTWRITVDLAQTFKDLTYDEATRVLVSLAATPGAIPFVHKADLYMVDMTVLSGTDMPGNTPVGTRLLTLVETDEVLQLEGVV